MDHPALRSHAGVGDGQRRPGSKRQQEPGGVLRGRAAHEGEMAVGGLIGGYLGGALTGKVNRTILRAVVVTIGFGLAAYYFWTLYAPAGLPFGGE